MKKYRNDILGLESFKVPIESIKTLVDSLEKGYKDKKEARKALKVFWRKMINTNKNLTWVEKKQIRESLYLLIDKS